VSFAPPHKKIEPIRAGERRSRGRGSAAFAPPGEVGAGVTAAGA